MAVARITLYKGITNIIDLVIKKNKIALPLELTNTDTFIVHLIELSTNSPIAVINQTESDNGIVEMTDLIDGKISITFKPELVATLKSLRGSQADNYYVRPTYKLLIEAETTNQGRFIVTLNRVGIN